MKLQILTPEQLTDVREKLKRANENVLNLKSEIDTFVSRSAHGGFSEDKDEAFQQWAELTKDGVPPRFSVLAGEIVHHLRSCLDHAAWMLSSDVQRRDHETAIAFPIWFGDKKGKSRYHRNVEGITNPIALKIIWDLQPCNTGKGPDDPLAIIHELDRVDKHHNLVLVVPAFNMGLTIPTVFLKSFMLRPDMEEKAFVDEFEKRVELNFTRHIAFAEFGRRKNQPVVPSLTQLCNAVHDIVQILAGEA
jgi:hypothetical protein